MSVMESLQLAQTLADLSSLNAAEPAAASSLLNASKTIDSAIEKIEKEKTQTQTQKVQQQNRPDIKRSASSMSSTASSRFDKINRHLLASQPPSRPGSVAATAPGTPTMSGDIDDDIDRASTLMTLHDIRAKLRQQDNTSLMKAREKINALAARQKAQEAELAKSQDESRKQRYSYPK